MSSKIGTFKKLYPIEFKHINVRLGFIFLRQRDSGL